MILKRHALVYLNEYCSPIPTKHDDVFLDWIQKGYPLIYTRQPIDIVNDHLQLGIPKFCQKMAIKQRYIFCVCQDAISKVCPLPSWNCIMPNDRCEMNPFVYGSFAWEYITQTPYITPQSDLDLFFIYKKYSLNQLLKTIQSIQEIKKYRIDGEIRFEPWGDCSILELLFTDTVQLLFKQEQGMHLVNRRDLYDRFPTLLS